MPEASDILVLDDIKILVNSFYDAVKEDDLLGPIFNERVKDWDKHLNIMYTFWETIILDQYTYKGTPFNQHRDLPVQKEHFDRWVQLFSQTVDNHFKGQNAENAKQRASQFATVFWSKIEFLRKG